MILQALYELYQRLLDEPDASIATPGYSTTRASFALNLSADGELLDLVDLRAPDTTGRQQNLVAREVNVPRQVIRSGTGVKANFMCDNSGYVLGVDAKGKPERAMQMFTEFRALHQTLLAGLHDAGAQAVLAFLDHWDPGQAKECAALRPLWDDVIAGGSIVFRLDGAPGFVHGRPAVRASWERHIAGGGSGPSGQCLITGESAPVARLHDSIKGVSGAQSTGASIVSFNLPAFESYGKHQSFNAPVSEAAAFGYVTALNFLLRSQRHRMRIGDATTVFWAERPGGLEEDMLAELLDPTAAAKSEVVAEAEASGDMTVAGGYHRDPQATRLVHDIMRQVGSGKPVRLDTLQMDRDVRFYILGLAPNAARLSIRFLHVDTFGSLVARIVQHYADMTMDLPPWEKDSVFPVWRIVGETAPLIGGKRDSKRASPLLAGAITRAILQGTDYPAELFTTMLSRVRTDHEVSAVGAGIVKACLLRQARLRGNADIGRTITVSLNEECADTGYLLGRLFALMEKAQLDAAGGQINATIRDRYFGAASATPQSVFPILLRLAQHHIAKAEYGGVIDKRIEGVVARIDGFPAHLSLEAQGMFVLGYYHQRQGMYQKRVEPSEVAKEA